MTLLQMIHDDIWVIRQSTNVLGMLFEKVMTVVRINQQDLVLYSPVLPSKNMIRCLDALGRVQHIIFVNNFHSPPPCLLRQIYPEAQYYLNKSLQQKKYFSQIPSSHSSVLEEGTEYPWSDYFDHQLIMGMPLLNEIVFFHRNSRILIAKDFILNPYLTTNGLGWITYSILGLKPGRYGQTRMFRMFIRDQNAYNDSVRQLDDWEIEKVIGGHGPVIEKKGASLASNLLLN